ncbi:MAG TPA: HAD-IB family hydrolase [Candidatus Kaiserbacteria bacterium]|nr:HAD-IB family hydrolase [Candidatus Kaiserbacteria bacterium]
MKEKRPVAVFDIDGTIFRSSLLLELVECLIERDIFPKETREVYANEHLQWLDRKGDYSVYVHKVVDAFGRQLKGVPYGEVADVAGEIIEEMKNRVYRYTRDLVQDLKHRGYYLLAISHSPKLIVDGFGYELGFDKTYGIFYSTGASGCFTGGIEDEDLIMNKGTILRRVVRKEGLTFVGSVAVGDTESDLPMLELAETSIAFNPNKLLYREARRNGWQVVVERKDVIYEL